MIFKNINSEDISGLIICSEPPISSSAIRTKETTIDGRDGAIVEKLGYKTRIRNVEIGLKKDANVDKILSYFSGEGDLIFKNENDKVYKAAIYEQVDLERLLRLRKGSVAFYCQPFKYKRNDIFETIKDNKVKEKKGKHLELLNCAEQNVVDLKLEGSTNQVTRSGKNFIDYTMIDANATLQNNGYYKVTFPSTGTILNGKFKPNTQYILSANGYGVVAGNNGILKFNYTDNTSTNFAIIGTTAKDYSVISESGKTISNIGITWGNDRVSYLKNLQLEEGTTATEYEQYGASPSPDYPAKIENVEGKNIWNKSEISEKTQTVNMNVGELNVKDVPIPFTFSSYLISNALTDTNVRVSFIDSNNSNIGAVKYGNTVTSTNKRSSITINEIPEGTVKIKFGIRLQDGGHTEKTQLEEGTVATPYVPYNSLAVKVTGKNIFDCANSRIIYNNGNTSYERLDNGLKLISDGVSQYNIIYFLVDTVKNLKDKTLTLSSDISFSKDNQRTSFGLFYTDINGGNRKTLVDLIDNTGITSEGKYQVTGQVEEGENRDYVCIGLRPNTASNFASGDYTIYDNLQVEIGETATPYEPYKSQVVTFPLGEGQKLMEGSYLADDGVHNVRKQVVLDGSDDENWQIEGANNFYSNIVIQNSKSSSLVLCNYQKSINKELGESENCFIGTSKKFNFQSDTINHTVADFKTWLSTHNLTVEYDLAEPEIVPYTEAQQEAYNQLQKLKLYKGQNTMFSLEGSIINLKYLEDTDEKVENQGNIYSKPIIRLEKTVFKEVEIAINGIRFKYNFEEDDYVEIDCEEMTVQYEGLDRNRRLVIDFEFPKLKEGNNDIVMYSGDCIIKCKRKDRWL